MMIVLFSLLACSPASDTGPSVDTPETNFPTWSGTQIGEEGDELCSYEEAPWDESGTDSPWTPDDLPAGTWTGTFYDEVSDSRAALNLSITASGEPLALVPPKEKDALCDVGLLQPVSLTFSAPPLLEVAVDAALIATDHIGVLVTLDESELSGELSPGILPDDAGTLVLEVSGYKEVGWSGSTRWILERPSGAEEWWTGSWSGQ